MVYDPNSEIQLDLPSDKEEKKELVEKFQKHEVNETEWEPVIDGDFKLDEIYVNTHKKRNYIQLSGQTEEGIYINSKIPLYAEDNLKRFARNLADVAGISTFQGNSGIFLEKEEIAEIRDKTADGQGRINLGKKYAGEDVEVVVIKK